MMRKLWIMGAIIVLVLVMAGSASAKGPMPVRIEGPGVSVNLHDVADSEPFSMALLEDFRAGTINRPGWAVRGYRVERYFVDDTGLERVFDHAVYYPNPHGGRGVVYYEGIHNGSSEYDGRWFRATPAGDAAFNVLLARHALPRILWTGRVRIE